MDWVNLIALATLLNNINKQRKLVQSERLMSTTTET